MIPLLWVAHDSENYEQMIEASARINGITQTRVLHLHQDLVDIMQAPEPPNLVPGDERPRLFDLHFRVLLCDDNVAIVVANITADIPLAVTLPAALVAYRCGSSLRTCSVRMAVRATGGGHAGHHRP